MTRHQIQKQACNVIKGPQVNERLAIVTYVACSMLSSYDILYVHLRESCEQERVPVPSANTYDLRAITAVVTTKNALCALQIFRPAHETRHPTLVGLIHTPPHHMRYIMTRVAALSCFTCYEQDCFKLFYITHTKKMVICPFLLLRITYGGSKCPLNEGPTLYIDKNGWPIMCVQPS